MPPVAQPGGNFIMEAPPPPCVGCGPLQQRLTDQLLATRDAAGFLGVSPRTLEDWRWKGGGPHYIALARNCIRYRLSDLEAWVQSRCRGSTTEGFQGGANQ